MAGAVLIDFVSVGGKDIPGPKSPELQSTKSENRR
jgi:hypothetical protein